MLRMGWGAVLSMETTTTSTSERPGSGSRAKWKRTRKPCWSYTVTGKMWQGRRGEVHGGRGWGRGRGAKPESKHHRSALHTRLTPGLAALLGMNEKTQTQRAALTLGSSAVRGIVWGQDGQVDF